MMLSVWDTAGSPLIEVASSLDMEGMRLLPLEWRRSTITIRFGGGDSSTQVDSLTRQSAVLLGPWLDFNPEVLAGPLEGDMEYILSERLALLGSAQRLLQNQCMVLNPVWRWTGSASIQDTGEQRRLLQEAGFPLAPEIVSNDPGELGAWGERLPGQGAEAIPGQLSGVDGLFPPETALERGAPFIPRRYLARRASPDLRVLVVLLGRTFTMPLSDESGGTAPVELDRRHPEAESASLLARLLGTQVCEVLVEGSGSATRALGLSRTLGVLTPFTRLPYALEQLVTILSTEVQP